MMTKQELLKEISMLPTQQRMLFAEYILASSNPSGSDIRANWTDEVQRRMDTVGNGRCEVIPSEELHDVLYGLIDENKS